MVRETNPIVMLTCLFSSAVPAGMPITVVPLKQQSWQVARRATCEEASSSESTIAAPSAERGPYRTTCENPWVRLRRTTVPRTQPSPGQ